MAGPIFPTPSKPGHPGQGLNFISELRANLPLGLAVWAVGGINPKNVKSVFAAGAQAAALRSWLVATEDPDPVASLLTALA
jgi:thiamine-phosphate pyrophosphorylase